MILCTFFTIKFKFLVHIFQQAFWKPRLWSLLRTLFAMTPPHLLYISLVVDFIRTEKDFASNIHNALLRHDSSWAVVQLTISFIYKHYLCNADVLNHQHWVTWQTSRDIYSIEHTFFHLQKIYTSGTIYLSFFTKKNSSYSVVSIRRTRLLNY